MLSSGLCLKQALLEIEHFVFWQIYPVYVWVSVCMPAVGYDWTALNGVKI